MAVAPEIRPLIFGRYGPGETAFPGVGASLEGWGVNSGWGSTPWGNPFLTVPTDTPLVDRVTRPRPQLHRVVTGDAQRVLAQVQANGSPVQLIPAEIDAITFRLRSRPTGGLAQSMGVPTNRIVNQTKGLVSLEIPAGWHTAVGNFWADLFIEFSNGIDYSYGTGYVIGRVRSSFAS